MRHHSRQNVVDPQGAASQIAREPPKALLHCEMFRATCLAMFWRHRGGTSCTKQFHSVTYPATAKTVARQVVRAVAERRMMGVNRGM